MSTPSSCTTTIRKEDSPKGKSKKYPKAKKTEFKKLQKGWENWDKPQND